MYVEINNAVKALQQLGAAARNIKFPQLFGRIDRSYTWYVTRYQAQPAELRRATQLEF